MNWRQIGIAIAVLCSSSIASAQASRTQSSGDAIWVDCFAPDQSQSLRIHASHTQDKIDGVLNAQTFVTYDYQAYDASTGVTYAVTASGLLPGDALNVTRGTTHTKASFHFDFAALGLVGEECTLVNYYVSNCAPYSVGRVSVESNPTRGDFFYSLTGKEQRRIGTQLITTVGQQRAVVASGTATAHQGISFVGCRVEIGTMDGVVITVERGR